MARLDWYIRANLKLQHLQLLVALDEMRGVGRVADYLHVTQPAVSKALATLESALELQLFERSAQGMRPTEHGLCLIRYARLILEQMASARDELRDISDGRVARVSLGVLPAAAPTLVPRCISLLEAETSEVTVTVREAETKTLLPLLRQGDIDLVVGNLPHRPLGTEFSTELLYKDPIVIVARPGHPLTRGKRVEWEMLSDYPMVLPTENTLTRRTIEDFFVQHRICISRRYVESISTMTNIGILRGTDSTGFLSREVARHFAEMGILSVLPLPLADVHIDLGLLWMTDRGLSKAQQLIRQLFRRTRDRIVMDDTYRQSDTRKDFMNAAESLP